MVARGEKGARAHAHHCAGDVYLMNNYTRSALLEAVRVRGTSRWDLRPHLITGSMAREGKNLMRMIQHC